MRIIVVQYAGDYSAAYDLLKRKGQETYHGHGYVLETLSYLASEGMEPAILCGLSNSVHNCLLDNGVRSIGLQKDPVKEAKQVFREIANYDPQFVVFAGPLTTLIRLATHAGFRTACMMANSSILTRFIDGFVMDPSLGSLTTTALSGLPTMVLMPVFHFRKSAFEALRLYHGIGFSTARLKRKDAKGALVQREGWYLSAQSLVARAWGKLLWQPMI